MPLYEILCHASDYPELKSSAVKLLAFTDMMEEMRRHAADLGLVEFYEYVCDRTGYVRMLQEKNDMESRGRLENVQELASSIMGFLENEPENPTLAGFLDEVALYTDLDSQADSDNCVTLMTMHSAKGLEFPMRVRGGHGGRACSPATGPWGMTEEMEEERRLCYVAMTRAKEKLTLTNARQRMLYGRTSPAMPSRFLKEIPEENMEWLGKPEPQQAASHWEGEWRASCRCVSGTYPSGGAGPIYNGSVRSVGAGSLRSTLCAPDAAAGRRQRSPQCLRRRYGAQRPAHGRRCAGGSGL